MYQLAVDQAKNPVAEVSLLKLPEQSEADAGVTVVTPLGTLLTTGVILQVDAGEKRQYPFAWCSQVGLLRALRPDQALDRRAEARQVRHDLAGLGRAPGAAGGAEPLALGLHRRLRRARDAGAAGWRRGAEPGARGRPRPAGPRARRRSPCPTCSRSADPRPAPPPGAPSREGAQHQNGVHAPEGEGVRHRPPRPRARAPRSGPRRGRTPGPARRS